MQIKITAIFAGEMSVVEVLGPCGHIRGLWKGEILGPDHIGEKFNIELSFLTEPPISVLAHPSTGFQSRVSGDSTTSFTGLVEQIYGDGLVDFRLAEDLIVLLRAPKEGCKENDWISFDMTCDDIEIYPF